MLGKCRKGDAAAASELMDAVYRDLRHIAARHFSREREDHTLEPTALVHEMYMKVFAGAEVEWVDRRHFFATASRQMRQILIDHGREVRAVRRGSGLKVSLDEAHHAAPGAGAVFDDVNEMLQRLEKTDAQAARVVEMKFFGGMTDDEVAEELDCSRSTVRRHWEFAKAWLERRMAKREKI